MLNYRHLHYFWSVAKSGGITRASERLHLTPQTLSGQLSQFEQQLGTPLFRRTGRRMELTESGQLAMAYAEEIFQVGAELEEMLRRRPEERLLPFRVGIADAVPKTIAHRLLSPALRLPEPVRLICREDRLDRLLAELAIHRLDMVLADRPIPANMDVKGHSHPLGQCGVAFLAEPTLAEKLAGTFPANLNDAPLLIPGEDSALRTPLLRWLERQNIRPRIVGEFDDSALMKAFGHTGCGVFPAPAASVGEVERQHGTVSLGQTSDIQERFFAISVERFLTHPAVVAVSEGARRGLFVAEQPSDKAPRPAF
ncbi:transcriptional activator NhaR [Candidatus Accumulibacter sp. ACC003]|uniref:transcriptional activator NhaR n=1 Tax=Candidatus Accumulibacter sp. ACC003 TaxID=2823334 RepID=UPI0025BB716E|nr:transcriptional activator NhaR [Candidatus Accumulibacter sp. ACC003]